MSRMKFYKGFSSVPTFLFRKKNSFIEVLSLLMMKSPYYTQIQSFT